MLVRTCIYFVSFLLSIFSIFMLIWSIKNTNKYICKKNILVSIIYILYLIFDLFLIGLLCVPVGLEVFLPIMLSLVAAVLYIVSIIINCIKRKKSDINIKSKKILITTIVLLILPILFLSTKILKYLYVINDSNLLLIYESDGNGSIGDGDTFAYAISDDSCKQFDLGIATGGFYLPEFLKKDVIEINDDADISKVTNYDITFNDDNIFVYENDKLICKINVSRKYFNNEFETAFYIKK